MSSYLSAAMLPIRQESRSGCASVLSLLLSASFGSSGLELCSDKRDTLRDHYYNIQRLQIQRLELRHGLAFVRRSWLAENCRQMNTPWS